MLRKCGVEAAHTLKAAHQGNLGDRQAGIGQQLLGSVQTPGLQILQRRHTEMGFKNAPDMALADAKPRR